jgi:hypothetical protein
LKKKNFLSAANHHFSVPNSQSNYLHSVSVFKVLQNACQELLTTTTVII